MGAAFAVLIVLGTVFAIMFGGRRGHGFRPGLARTRVRKVSGPNFPTMLAVVAIPALLVEAGSLPVLSTVPGAAASDGTRRGAHHRRRCRPGHHGGHHRVPGRGGAGHDGRCERDPDLHRAECPDALAAGGGKGLDGVSAAPSAHDYAPSTVGSATLARRQAGCPAPRPAPTRADAGAARVVQRGGGPALGAAGPLGRPDRGDLPWSARALDGRLDSARLLSRLVIS